MFRSFKNWIIFGLVGLLTGLSFHLMNLLLSNDEIFKLWEFVISLFIPLILSIIISRLIKKNTVIVVTVSMLTLVIPVLGPSFGGTGSEPMWIFALLGLIGGLFWGFPFVIFGIFSRKK